MMRKVALFAFQGDPMCFIHVLLNALDLTSKGNEVRIVLEGSATKLVPELARQGSPLFHMYRQARGQNLFDGACKACSSKLNVAEEVQQEGLSLLDDMSGHPSMSHYMARGYEIITF
jgi:hypothetical protein